MNGPGHNNQHNGNQNGQNGETPQNPNAFALDAPARLKRSALRKGVTFKVRVPGAGKVTATATAPKKVGSGSTTAKAAGTAKVKVKFTKKALRTLKRAKKVTVKVTYRPADGGPAQTTKTTVALAR